MASLDPHHCSLRLAETPYNVRIAMRTSKDSPRHENDGTKTERTDTKENCLP